ncbi:MAG: CrcB family protein [Campylobacter sp.]|nr:CrcB family protein [Campylobacter sp.]
MLNTLLVVGLGGFLGAIFRMLSYELIYKILPHFTLLATLFVNVLGSFLMGVLFFYLQNKGDSVLIKNFIGIGFLGAFTTFSTFTYENLMLLQNQNYVYFILNVLLNVGLCLFALWVSFLIFK